MANDKQRRAAQRRRLQRQAQRRAERARRRRRINLIVTVAGTLAIIGLVIGIIAATSGSSTPAKKPTRSPSRSAATSTPAPSTSATSTSATNTSAAPSTRASASASVSPSRTASARRSHAATARTTDCRYSSDGHAARRVHRPAARALASGATTVALRTSRGPLTFRLNRGTAPCAVNSFVSLVRQGFYTRTSCHRLVTKNIYVLQCGDPTGTGRGGPGYTFTNEGKPAARDSRGALVMSNGEPDSNGSQFFIVWKSSALGDYTTFGRVTSGMASLNPVAAAGTTNGSADGTPKLPVTFDSLRVT